MFIAVSTKQSEKICLACIKKMIFFGTPINFQTFNIINNALTVLNNRHIYTLNCLGYLSNMYNNDEEERKTFFFAPCGTPQQKLWQQQVEM